MRNLLIALFLGIPVLQIGCSGGRSEAERTSGQGLPAKILVLEDCDSNYRTPTFYDAVMGFTAEGKRLRKAGALNICETVGGCRSLSVGPEGRIFVVCENVANKLTGFETETGNQLWTLKGAFTSATISTTGVIYALNSSGTIYGKEVLVISEHGQILQRADVGGFDIAYDPNSKVLWLVGADVKKCDLELRVLMKLTPIRWCAVSVDVNPDSSVWVAERQHPNSRQSQDRIVKISSSGVVLKSLNLPWSPLCLRVDRSDGSVWVTGVASRAGVTERLLESIEKRTGHLPIGKSPRAFLTRPNVWSRTQKRDAEGKLLQELNQGGFSLDIDQRDHSIWVGGSKKVYHYSSNGAQLAAFAGVTNDQKYVVVVPDSTKAKATNVSPGEPW